MEKLKCDECNGTYERKNHPYYTAGQYIGLYPMLVCDTCKDILIEASICAEMEKELKRRKLWGLQAKNKMPIILSN